MVRFNGAFLWYNAAQISVGDDDSGLRAVLESAHGPVAQLDRASDFGSEGWGFDSLRGRHFSAPLSIQDIRVFLAIQCSCPWGTSTKSDFNRTSANLVPAPVEVNLSRPVAIPTALKARCIRTFR